MKDLLVFLLSVLLFYSCSNNVTETSNPTEIKYEGKTYHIVQIGEQYWLKENLDVGTMIFGNQDQTNNGTIEKYCYNDQESNCDKYGGLYAWNEAMQCITTPGTRGICPEGWHIPTYAEWQTLRNEVNNDGLALKAIGQGTGSGEGTNTSGFSALLAGFRYRGSDYRNLDRTIYLWSSTELEPIGVINPNGAIT